MHSEVEKVIIFTHYSPSVDERTKDPTCEKSAAESAFMTDLRGQTSWNRPAVEFWAFGYTHYNDDSIEETSKRVVVNQKGYYIKLTSSKKGTYGPRLTNGKDVQRLCTIRKQQLHPRLVKCQLCQYMDHQVKRLTFSLSLITLSHVIQLFSIASRLMKAMKASHDELRSSVQKAQLFNGPCIPSSL